MGDIEIKVRNVHERHINAPVSRVGELLDGLASEHDCLWPADRWPAMRFDCGLAKNALGGHGPIRYSVASYQAGRAVRFRFTKPVGFDGHHGFDVEESGPDGARLRHVVEMDVKGRAALRWHLVIRSLHDALIEDSLDRAQRWNGERPEPREWSLWVRFLRWLLRNRRRSP